MKNSVDAKNYFEKLLDDDSQKSTGLAAIETLMQVLSASKAPNVSELTLELKNAINKMLTTDKSAASIQSATELFLRFISIVETEHSGEFDLLMDVYKKRGAQFIRRISQSRAIISNFALPFIQHNSKILIHSYSKVVLSALLEAKKCGHVFQVFVTESAPDFAGKKMHAILLKHDIDSTQIVDGAVGYLMERIDVVIFGSESIMENGGIVNKIGSLSIAVVAKSFNKKVYVLAESTKFSMGVPLNQSDIPNKFKYHASTLKSESNNLKYAHPLVDYVAPTYIDLLITDLGIFNADYISTGLNKLYS